MAVTPFLLVLVVAAAVATVTAVLRRDPSYSERPVRAVHAHAGWTSAAAAIAAVVVGLVAAVASPLGIDPGAIGVRGIVIICAAACAHLFATLVGELTWPRPEGQVRRARLERRGLLDAAPRWLIRTTTVALAATTLTIAVGAMMADPDGRSYSVQVDEFTTQWRMTVGDPFPGPVYGVPAAVGLLAVVLLALVALRVIADRPATNTADDSVEDGLRRASAHRVLRTTAVACLVVTGGLLWAGGQAMTSAVADAGDTPVLGVVVLVLGGAVLSAAAVVLCVPADARLRTTFASAL